MFPLVQEMAAKDAPIRVPVVVACRVLGFSRQAYYQWVKQPVSKREADDQHLIQVLRQLHAEDPEFGYRFLTDEMQDLGYVITERRGWRLCKQAGIRSVITKRKSSAGRAGAPVGDDLVEREFTAAGPNRLWLTDITEQWTNEGRLYMCAVKDVWSNRIVGYSIGPRMQASLAVRALENAVMQRDHPVGTVVHSDYAEVLVKPRNIVRARSSTDVRIFLGLTL